MWYGEESPPPPPRGTSVASLLANSQVPTPSSDASPGEPTKRVGPAGAPVTGTTATAGTALDASSKGQGDLQFREPTVTGSAVVKTIDPRTLAENPWSDWNEVNPEDVASV